MSSREVIELDDSSSDSECSEGHFPHNNSSLVTRNGESFNETEDDNRRVTRSRKVLPIRRSQNSENDSSNNDDIFMISSSDDDDDNKCKVDLSLSLSQRIQNRRQVTGSQSLASDKVEELPKETKKEKADAEAYLGLLRKNVKKRSYPLSQVTELEVISTGRTIKKLAAWNGHWPALREFLQNTIDHLHLMDGKTGRRRKCINLKTDTPSSSDILATFEFTCQNQAICKITAMKDEVIIEQNYTFPIASRALDTGVPDTSKFSTAAKSNDNDQAGGFGDGFKTAAVALIANSKKTDFHSLQWDFYATEEKKKITWVFGGYTKEKVGTFAKCDVLQVEIKKEDLSDEEIELNAPVTCDYDRDYVMKQFIRVKGIGKSFIEEAVPRLVVFWNIDESTIISAATRPRKSGGDFIGPVSGQQCIIGSIRPQSGVYVRGIYVCPTKVKDTIMTFFGNRLEVTGRDRNQVDDEELVQAMIYILHSCNNKEYLSELLEPLRGQCDESNSTQRRSKRIKNESSWLLKSPRFFNRVVEQDKDFILHQILNIPRDSIFVSRKTTESKDPFISWAASFLNKNGVPLVPIDKNANRYLFVEVDEYEMTDRCVQILKRNANQQLKGKSLNATNFSKIFRYLGIGKTKAFFLPDVAISFIHNCCIFIPDVDISRELLVKVLNVCHTRLEGTDSECYSSLMQSIFEKLPSNHRFTEQDVIDVISRAKEIKKESRNFLCIPARPASNEKSFTQRRKTSEDHVISIDEEEEVLSNRENQFSSKLTRKKNNLRSTMPPNLLEQINRINRLTNNNKRKRDEDVGLSSIIPATEFESDNAGDDTCLRPSSSLTNIPVDTSMGGGNICCDTNTVDALKSNKMSENTKKKICRIRSMIEEAIKIIKETMPSLKSLLQRVSHGYDSANDTYEAFCDGRNIIINIYSYLYKIQSNQNPRDLIHDLVITVTHEIAHFLEPGAGHGPLWRDTHMNMVVQIMSTLEMKK